MASSLFATRPLDALLLIGPYGPSVARALREVDCSLPVSIGTLDDLGEVKARHVLEIGLDLACRCQNVANIELGRAIVLGAPRARVTGRIVEVARATLDLGEAWETARIGRA